MYKTLNQKYFKIILILFLSINFYSCFIFTDFINPLDPGSEYYQGFPTVENIDEVVPIKPLTSIVYPPTLISCKLCDSHKYKIQIATDESFLNVDFEKEYDSNIYFLNDWNPAKRGGKYYFRVKANNNIIWGDWSNPVEFCMFMINKPVIRPSKTTYDTATTIYFENIDENTIIKFTLDESLPNRNNGLTYSSPFTISTSCYLKAIAYNNSGDFSDVTSKQININIPGYSDKWNTRYVDGSIFDQEVISFGNNNSGSYFISYLRDNSLHLKSITNNMIKNFQIQDLTNKNITSSTPVLISSNGVINIIYNVLDLISSTNTVYHFISNNGNNTLVNITDVIGSISINKACIDKNNNIHIIYLTDNSLYYWRYNGSIWTNQKVCSIESGDLSISIVPDNSSNIHIAYSYWSGWAKSYMYYITNKNGTWEKSAISFGLGYNPIISINNSGNPVISYNKNQWIQVLRYNSGEFEDSNLYSNYWGMSASWGISSFCIGKKNGYHFVFNFRPSLAYARTIDGISTVETIDTPIADKCDFYKAFIYLDSESNPHILYIDADNNWLKYSYRE